MIKGDVVGGGENLDCHATQQPHGPELDLTNVDRCFIDPRGGGFLKYTKAPVYTIRISECSCGPCRTLTRCITITGWG